MPVRHWLLFCASLLAAQTPELERRLKLAQAHLETDAYTEAIRELRAALAMHARIPGANYQLGYSHWKLGDMRAAEQAFLRELSFAPPDPYSLYYLGRIRLDAGDTPAAIEFFEKALRASDVLDVRRRLASAYLRAGRLQEAVQFLRVTLESHSNDGDLHYLLARAYQRQGRRADANQHFELARASKTKLNDEVRFLLDFRRALAESNRADSHALARRLMQSNEPEVLSAAGAALGEHQLHDQALPFLASVAERQPDNPEALYNLGRCHALLGEAASAILHLQRAIKLRDDFYEAHIMLASLSVQAGNNEEGIRHLRSASALRPANTKVLAMLGLQYIEGRYFADAVETLEKAVKLDPDNPDLRFLLIQAYYRNSDFEQALATAVDVRLKFPTLALSHFHAGAQFNNMGRLDAARSALEDALRLDPQLAEARVMLGDVLFKRGDAEASISHFRAVIGRDPAATDAHVGLGRALIQLKRYEEAAHAMETAVTIDARVPSVHLYLSQAYRALGKLDEAQKEAKIFAELNRRRAEARDMAVERTYK